MLTIRLTRKGKKNQPFFRLVVVDKRRSSKAGKATEDLGYVDKLAKRQNLNKDRILYWISKGAQPSPSVHNLLVSAKIINAKKIKVDKKPKAKEGVAPTAVAATAPAPTETKPPENPPAA
jgi:small subunit ribosomal protein S16